jgi:hypothetical protein
MINDKDEYSKLKEAQRLLEEYNKEHGTNYYVAHP